MSAKKQGTRPFVFSNLATSLDGKIATVSRVHFPLGTPADREQMQVLRRQCDAILMGATTLRAYKKFCSTRGATVQPANVIVSSRLEGISPSWDFFKNPKHRRILCVAPGAPASAIQKFSKTCEVIVLKKPTPKNPTAVQLVDALAGRGFKRLLVEGGGGLMWDFASEDLIDEYHVTLTPRVLGGVKAPTLVDGEGLEPKEVVNLKLAQCRVLGDELYLIYRKTGRRGP